MKRLALGVAIAIAAFGACSSEGDADGAGGSAGSAGDANVPSPNGCVQPGDHGNELGIGEYCSPAGHQCRAFEATAPFCIADAVPELDQWFCTRLNCTDDSVCGPEAHCLIDARGSACVPNRCVEPNG